MDFQSTLLGWPGPAVKVELFLSLSYYRGGKRETKTKTRINPNQEKNTTEPSATNCPGNERLNVGTAHQFFFFFPAHQFGSFSSSMNGYGIPTVC